MPPVKIFWYDGMTGAPQLPEGLPEGDSLGDLPRGAGLIASDGLSQPAQPQPERPAAAAPKAARAGQGAAGRAAPARPSANGSLFVGEKGFITTGTYGAGTRLVPPERMKGYKFPPQLLTRSPGHYRDWIRACKGGEPSCSDFRVAGPFTEWILLGVLALRFEGKLEWDSAKMKVTNLPEANRYVKPTFRKGWKLG
jgi:hypothetical protein